MRTCRSRASPADAARRVSHALREPSDHCVADRGQQRVAVEEVAVGRIGHDADHTRHLAEHERIRTARAGEFDASLDSAACTVPRGRGPRRGDRSLARIVQIYSGQCTQHV